MNSSNSDAALPDTVGLVLHFRKVEPTMRCLESLQTEGVARVVVVDNTGDQGESWAKSAPSLDRLSRVGLEVVVERPAVNLGFSAGVNFGLQAIHRRFGDSCVLLINSDATLREGAHVALRETECVEHPCIVAARMECKGRESLGFAHYHPLLSLILTREAPGTFPYLSACCVLIPPSLARIKLFDEEFFFYGEDIELGWRLARQGVRLVSEARAVVDHQGSGSSRNGSLFYEYHMARAHLLLAKKLAKGRMSFCAYIVGRAFALPIRAVLRSIRNVSATPLVALWMATFDVSRGRSQLINPP